MVLLQIGAPDLAMPRLNAMSFWLQPVGALLIFTGVFSGQGADTGWTGYAPYVVDMVNGHDGNTFSTAGQIMLVASSTLTGINNPDNSRDEGRRNGLDANAIVHMVHTNCKPDAFPLNPSHSV